MEAIWYVLGGVLIGMAIMVIFRRDTMQITNERGNPFVNNKPSPFGGSFAQFDKTPRYTGGAADYEDDDDESETNFENIRSQVNHSVSPYQPMVFRNHVNPFRPMRLTNDSQLIEAIQDVHAIVRTNLGFKSTDYTWYIDYNLINRLRNLPDRYVHMGKFPYTSDQILGSEVVAFDNANVASMYPIMMVRNLQAQRDINVRYLIAYDVTNGVSSRIGFTEPQKSIIESHENMIATFEKLSIDNQYKSTLAATERSYSQTMAETKMRLDADRAKQITDAQKYWVQRKEDLKIIQDDVPTIPNKEE